MPRILPNLSLIRKLVPSRLTSLGMPGLIAMTGLLLSINPYPYQTLPAQAVQMADGTVYFENPPSLGEMVTSNKSAGSLLATYALTIVVPKDAGEPLQRLTLASQGPDRIGFHLNRTTAYLGNNRKNLTGLGEVTQDRETRNLSITFNPPIPPGAAVTVNLRPRQNPWVAGVYLFGVTAFPQGEKASGQFLGYGRLHFYSPDWWF